MSGAQAVAAPRRSLVIGIALMVLAATGFGLIPVFARAAYAHGITPEGALVWRFGLPVVFFVWFLPRALANPRQALEAIAVSLFLGVSMIGYFQGFAKLDVAVVVLIFFMHPFFAILFASLLARRLPPRRELIAAGLIVLAAVTILEPSRIAGDPYAIAFAFMPPVAYGLLLVVLAERLGGLDPMARAAASYTGIALVAAALALWHGIDIAVPASTTGWLAGLGLFTVCGIAPQLALMNGAPRLGPERTAIVGTLELVVALAAGWTLLAEPVHLREIAGAALVFIAVALAASPKRVARVTPAV